MELIIKDMAKAQVSEDMLKQVDMNSLMKDFQSDYNKLDDMKQARARHENQGFVMRWFNSNELKNAQLDAVELQSSFSKKLGQLMVISIMQSQLLNKQQGELKTQQEKIQNQAEEIAKANKKISDKQQTLCKHQAQLNKLIDDYFNLKGLTAEGAKKLIAIAEEVKQTKTDLLKSVSHSVNQVQCLADSQTQQLQEQTALQEQRLQEVQQNLADSQKKQSQWLDKQLEHKHQVLDNALVSQRELLVKHHQQINLQAETFQRQLTLQFNKLETQTIEKFNNINVHLEQQGQSFTDQMQEIQTFVFALEEKAERQNQIFLTTQEKISSQVKYLAVACVSALLLSIMIISTIVLQNNGLLNFSL